MKLRVKDLSICTGSISIAILNASDAAKLDLHNADRILLKTDHRTHITASLDITTSSELVLPGEIALFEEVYQKIGAKNGDLIDVHIEKKPKSLALIRKKLLGTKLSADEMGIIVEDITQDRLTDIEIAFFVAACSTQELDDREVIALSRAMVKNGKTLHVGKGMIMDKHCIGGVAANRTTMVVVPIIAAAGLTIPKTSSRAITSAAGTSDTVEVLCEVSLSLDKMKQVVQKTNGCLVWGGSMELAPADDKIIRVEHLLSLDPEGQLVASILSKKKSVGATHVLIDIPIGRGTKAGSMARALRMKKKFEKVARALSMKIRVIITDGSQPIGNGIGPVLEARDVLWTLQNAKQASKPLKEKSIEMAGEMLDLAGKTRPGQGRKLARHLLEKGMAYIKFIEILKEQGAKVIYPEQLELAAFTATYRAPRSGKIVHVDNGHINKVARIAGAPVDKKAGLYLFVHKGTKVKKGERLLTIYADSKERLSFAKMTCRTLLPIVIK
jgi:putative thymidine phosphorylase